MEDMSVLEAPDELEVEVDPAADPAIEGDQADVDPAREPASDSTAAEAWKGIRELLKSSPQHHAQVKKALHHMERFNEKLPDGIEGTLKKLDAMRQLDTNPSDPEYVPGSAPIEDVVSNAVAEIGFWRDFDTAFQAGNGAVIKQMIEANSESFQKLVPEAINEYATMNPQAYSTLICQGIAPYLNSSRIPLHMALAERVLPAVNDPMLNDPKNAGFKTLVEAFQAFKGVFDEIENGSKQKIEIKPAQQHSGSSQAQGQGQIPIETREMNVLHDQWLTDIRPRSEKVTVDEVQRQFPGKRFTAAEVSQIRNAVKEEVGARVRTNTGYQQKIKGYLKAKNKASYAMTVESEHKKIIPGAVKRAVGDVLEKRKVTGIKKPAVAAQGVKPAQQQAGDFEWITDTPGRLKMQLDFRRMGGQANEMMRSNRAFVQGRTKEVRWKPRS